MYLWYLAVGSSLLGGSLFLTVAAGCQSILDPDPAPIDLKFYNYTDRVQPLKLELLRTGNHTHNAAAVVNRDFEVPQPEDGESAVTLRKPGIAKRQAYVARVKLKYGDGTWAHHHFYFPVNDEESRTQSAPPVSRST